MPPRPVPNRRPDAARRSPSHATGSGHAARRIPCFAGRAQLARSGPFRPRPAPCPAHPVDHGAREWGRQPSAPAVGPPPNRRTSGPWPDREPARLPDQQAAPRCRSRSRRHRPRYRRTQDRSGTRRRKCGHPRPQLHRAHRLGHRHGRVLKGTLSPRLALARLPWQCCHLPWQCRCLPWQCCQRVAAVAAPPSQRRRQLPDRRHGPRKRARARRPGRTPVAKEHFCLHRGCLHRGCLRRDCLRPAAGAPQHPVAWPAGHPQGFA